MKEARKFRRPVRLVMIMLMAFIGHVSNECVDQAATCPQFASSCNLESASINGKPIKQYCAMTCGQCHGNEQILGSPLDQKQAEANQHNEKVIEAFKSTLNANQPLQQLPQQLPQNPKQIETQQKLQAFQQQQALKTQQALKQSQHQFNNFETPKNIFHQPPTLNLQNFPANIPKPVNMAAQMFQSSVQAAPKAIAQPPPSQFMNGMNGMNGMNAYPPNPYNSFMGNSPMMQQQPYDPFINTMGNPMAMAMSMGVPSNLVPMNMNQNPNQFMPPMLGSGQRPNMPPQFQQQLHAQQPLGSSNLPPFQPPPQMPPSNGAPNMPMFPQQPPLGSGFQRPMPFQQQPPQMPQGLGANMPPSFGGNMPPPPFGQNIPASPFGQNMPPSPFGQNMPASPFGQNIPPQLGQNMMPPQLGKNMPPFQQSNFMPNMPGLRAPPPNLVPIDDCIDGDEKLCTFLKGYCDKKDSLIGKVSFRDFCKKTCTGCAPMNRSPLANSNLPFLINKLTNSLESMNMRLPPLQGIPNMQEMSMQSMQGLAPMQNMAAAPILRSPSSEACEDNGPECANAASLCTTNSYIRDMKFSDYCRKTCNKCSASSSSSTSESAPKIESLPSSPSFPTIEAAKPTTEASIPAPKKSGSSCEDKSASCIEFIEFCKNPKASVNSQPIFDYCPKTCGLC